MENGDSYTDLKNYQLVITSLVAGAVAGALAKTTIAPLDRTKINFQVRHETYSAKKAWNFLVTSYRTDGFLSLWRGNSATMARIIPYAAIQFTAHEQWKRVLGVDVDTEKQDDPERRFLAGSLAGVTSQSMTYPLDLARARMAVTRGQESYSTLIQVFATTWKESGIKGFYRGYIPTILGVVPYAGTSFFTYGTLKNKYKEQFGEPSAVANLVFGACAGITGQCTSYPLDIVRRRMQTANITGGEYKTVYGTLKKIYKEEGLKNGYFKGLSMNWIKGPIAVYLKR
ncbi:dephosphocoenzyme A carrier isoform X2 [Lycorma delicatula]|uniref:dephosphocoenzyme A carrier isoform X2 n=1 Tax=Lycorma delicatula TaxID=130591 RepID=UPI003F513095